MFAVLPVITLFAYSISKNAIECSTIWRESVLPDVQDSDKFRDNLTLLKKIDHSEEQKGSIASLKIKQYGKRVILNSANKPPVESEGMEIFMTPLLEKESRAVTSSTKNSQPEENAGRRKPKFLGSLGFLAGLGAASLANAASENVNVFANILNDAVPLPIGPPGYFAGFYKPQPYIPFSYPVLYPVPNFVNNYPIPVNGIPVIPAQMSQRDSNATESREQIEDDDNSFKNIDTEKQTLSEKIQDVKEAAETQMVVKKTIKPEAEVDGIVSLARNDDEESRQSSKPATKPAAVSNSTTPAPDEPKIMNKTESSNATVPMASPFNNTGTFPFYGYYGGRPQDFSQVILTTEDPHQRYLKDYPSDTLPFERPALIFNPYQNSEHYSNPFVNSFSGGDSYPEFLNTIDSDRYSYDSANRPSFNGFRPIL